MRSTSTSLRRYGAALSTALLALVLTLGAAPAHADHGKGRANSDHGSEGGRSHQENGPPAGSDHGGQGRETPVTEEALTEDNDDNDASTPNNVSDEGDNAHPSGRDRSVEAGGSGNQGASTSDPDGDSNGGADKPGGAGGTDLADQDGNNGCGNDDDFEDDNNGNCGGPDRTDEQVLAETATTTTVVEEEQSTATAGAALSSGTTTGSLAKAAVNGAVLAQEIETSEIETPEIETMVMGASFERPRAAATATETHGGGASVLGASFTRGNVLARTGSEILVIALTGLVLAVLGFGLTRFSRRSTV